MLKLGLAGTWHVHFEGYVKEFLCACECKIVALWDSDEKKAKKTAEKYSCAGFTDIDEFYKEDFDAVLVCCETNLHKDAIIKAAKAKKHIFTEKALTAFYKDALEIKKAVDDAGVKFCISFPWRSQAFCLWIKKALDEEKLGKVSFVRIRNAHNGVSGAWLPPSFLDPVPACGGAMMDLGAHGLYLLNWFLGESVKCTSVFTNFICKTVDDNCISVFSYPNGAIGVNETSFVSGNNPFEIEISGTKGAISAGGMSGGLCINTGEGCLYPDPGKNAKSPLRFFIDAALNGEDVPYGIDDAVALTKTMEAAYKNII